MLSDADLLQLFRGDESDRVERKQSSSDLDKVAQAICAFANDLPNHRSPGVLFVGQRDDRTCAGLVVDDDLLLRLSNLRSDGRILPFPPMNVRKMSVDGCDVAVIEVAPSDNPPIRFEGRIWIRVGPRRAIASAEEERRLLEKRQWGSLPFDARGIRGATLSDLDMNRFRLEYLPVAISPEALRENRRPEDMQLQALRLVQPDGTPTATALLILGIEPRRWLPGAYIQFLRLDGPKLTDIVMDHREVAGTVADQLRQLDELTSLHIARRAVIGGVLRGERSDYPEVAIRQLVRNAIMHRTYEGTGAPTRVTWFSDRIEIQNPGGPYGMVTRSNFGQPGITDYRNPTLAEALKSLGFVERFGVGIAIARDQLATNGNPDLEFQVEDGHVAAIIRRAS